MKEAKSSKEAKYSNIVYYLFILSLILMLIDVALHYNIYAASLASEGRIENGITPTILTISTAPLWIMGYAGLIGLMYPLFTKQLTSPYSYLLAVAVILIVVFTSIGYIRA